MPLRDLAVLRSAPVRTEEYGWGRMGRRTGEKAHFARGGTLSFELPLPAEKHGGVKRRFSSGPPHTQIPTKVKNTPPPAQAAEEKASHPAQMSLREFSRFPSFTCLPMWGTEPFIFESMTAESGGFAVNCRKAILQSETGGCIFPGTRFFPE